LDKIETAINRLKQFPESGSIPRYSTLKKQKFRVKIVEQHLVFYKINKENQLVIIYAIVDGR
jgi:toxin ParE1/3/4